MQLLIGLGIIVVVAVILVIFAHNFLSYLYLTFLGGLNTHPWKAVIGGILGLVIGSVNGSIGTALAIWLATCLLLVALYYKDRKKKDKPLIFKAERGPTPL